MSLSAVMSMQKKNAENVCEKTGNFCSGGCAANAYNFSGDICGAYDIGCELQKKRIECAIMIKAAEADCE